MVKRVYWLIDDDDDESDDYRRILKRASNNSLKIQALKPVSSLHEYDHLLGDEQTGGFIIDYKLDELLGIPYTGLQLVSHLRQISPKLPCFILTKYAQQPGLESHAGSADEVIDKSDVRNFPGTYTARLLRRLGEYEAALDERQRRLRELVEKKLKTRLTQKEEIELNRIRNEIELPGMMSDPNREQRLQEDIKSQQQLLDNLKEALATLEKTEQRKTTAHKKQNRKMAPKKR